MTAGKMNHAVVLEEATGKRFDTGASSCAMTCFNAEQPCRPMRAERWASALVLDWYRRSISRRTTY